MTKVNIEGLGRGEVLAALFNAAKPQGLGILQFVARDMNPSEGEAMLRSSDYFDYLEGRVIKTRIEEGCKEIDATLYDRDNGAGAAAEAIDRARRSKTLGSEDFFVPSVFMRSTREEWTAMGFRVFKFEVLGGVLRVWSERSVYSMPEMVFSFSIDEKKHGVETITARVRQLSCKDEFEFKEGALHVIFEVVRSLAEGK